MAALWKVAKGRHLSISGSCDGRIGVMNKIKTIICLIAFVFVSAAPAEQHIEVRTKIALAGIGMTPQEYRDKLGSHPDLIGKIGRGGVEVIYSGRSRNNGREFKTGAIFYDGHAQVVFFFYTDGKEIPLSDRQHMLSTYDGKWERVPKEEEKIS